MCRLPCSHLQITLTGFAPLPAGITVSLADAVTVIVNGADSGSIAPFASVPSEASSAGATSLSFGPFAMAGPALPQAGTFQFAVKAANALPAAASSAPVAGGGASPAFSVGLATRTGLAAAAIGLEATVCTGAGGTCGSGDTAVAVTPSTGILDPAKTKLTVRRPSSRCCPPCFPFNMTCPRCKLR